MCCDRFIPIRQYPYLWPRITGRHHAVVSVDEETPGCLRIQGFRRLNSGSGIDQSRRTDSSRQTTFHRSLFGYHLSINISRQITIHCIMRTHSVAVLVALQAVFVNTFELPFNLPFGLDSIFGTTSGSRELFALHEDLINFPSVTGSEHDVGVYLADYLTARNYTVERIPGRYHNCPSGVDLQLPGRERTFTLISARIEIHGAQLKYTVLIVEPS